MSLLRRPRPAPSRSPLSPTPLPESVRGGVLGLALVCGLLAAATLPAQSRFEASAEAPTAARSWMAGHHLESLDLALPLRARAGDPTPIAREVVARLALAVGTSPDHEIFLETVRELSNGALVLVFREEYRGVPVADARARVVVAPAGATRARVALVSHGLTAAVGSAHPADARTSDEVLARLADAPPGDRVERWSTPELLYVRHGDGLRLAWRALGRHVGAERVFTSVFTADACSGQLIDVRDAIRDYDIAGTVNGYGSPGLLPDVSYNPAELTPLSGVTVTGGGASAVSDANGEFVLPTSATSVTATADLASPWATAVDPFFFSPLTTSATGTTAGGLDLVFGPASDETTVAGVNCVQHVTAAHDFISNRNPTITEIDLAVECVVGIPFPCLAFYDPFFIALNFGVGGAGFPGGPGTCVDLAYSTIIVHEYGHFVHLQLGIDGDAFGEGFSDALAALVFDDPVSGIDAFGPGTIGRDVSTPDVQYPCSDPDPHQCGLLLAGVWWDIKEELQLTQGSDEGLEFARQLFVDWMAVTAGGSPQSAHPGTALEVLAVDDDDGDLDNGTPHSTEICAAFATHGIDCPTFTTPTGATFVRSDCNGDGELNLTDAVVQLAAVFQGEPVPCDDACDANDDGALDVSDPIYNLAAQFLLGSPLPPGPYPVCGVDPTADALDCAGAVLCP